MEDVAIFWDYDNCPAPANTSGYRLLNSIRSMAQSYGSIKSLKAYLGIAEQFSAPKTQNLRSELQSSGVSLIDCPHNGRKDVADKMMIVDMLTHAIDNPSPGTVVLISGDRDFAYALSVLRLRRYRVILCTPAYAHASHIAQASQCVDWANLVSTPTDTSPQWASNHFGTSRTPLSRGDSRSAGSFPTYQSSREAENTQRNDQGDMLRTLADRRRPSADSSSNTYNRNLPGCERPKQDTSTIESKQDAIRLGWTPSEYMARNSSSSSLLPLNSPSLVSNQSLGLSGRSIHVNTNITKEISGTTPRSMNISLSNNIDNSSTKYISTSIMDEIQNTTTTTHSENILTKEQVLLAPAASTPISLPTPLPLLSSIPHPLSIPSPGFLPAPSSSATVTTVSVPLGSVDQSATHPQRRAEALSPSTLASASTKPPTFSKGVPAHFAILIKTLQACKSKGQARVLRSQVGEQISHNGVTYQKAGVQKFSEYVGLAEKEGLVQLGGRDGKDWISLNPEWYTAFIA